MSKFEIDLTKLNYDIPEVWDLICSGDTIGVFQLESNTGRRYAREIKPRNLRELSDLIALIRPGCLQSKLEDGQSLTHHYIMRKRGEEEVTYVHESLEPILKDTFGIMVYQEAAIRIGLELAGMTDAEADLFLRYAIGKKKKQLIEEGKAKFIEGCIQNNIPEKSAERIFSWIEACARYSFNMSHSFNYAQHAYNAAFAKTFWPKEYYTEYLKHSKYRGVKKNLEKRLLIQDARKHGFDVRPHSIKDKNMEYDIINGNIHVGFIDIKGCGATDWVKWQKWLETNKMPDTWDEFLVYASSCFNSGCLEALIMSGALDCFGQSRNKMLYQANIYLRLSSRQYNYVQDNYNGSIGAMLEAMKNEGTGRSKPCYNIKSYQNLLSAIKDWNKEAYSTWTTAIRIELAETDLIGAPLTCSRIEESETNFTATATCLDLQNMSPSFKTQKILCWLTRVKQIETKNKQPMAFVSFSDGMYEIEEGIIFPKEFERYYQLLIPELEVLLVGTKNNKGSFVINKVVEV